MPEPPKPENETLKIMPEPPKQEIKTVKIQLTSP